MSIWEYKNVSTAVGPPLQANIIDLDPGHPPHCPFCFQAPLLAHPIPDLLPQNWEKYIKVSSDLEEASLVIRICKRCGWWYIASYRTWPDIGNVDADEMYGVGACITKLDQDNLEPGLSEVRSRLSKDFKTSKTEIHPRHFEEVVASVLRDMGYRTRVTGYTNDGGIDIILDGPGNKLIGVQVKRWKNKIGVDQIRELLGALVLRQLTDGLVITTSTYMAGAAKLTRKARELGFCIELVNGRQFFEALELLKRSVPPNPETLLRLVSSNQMKPVYSDDANTDAPSSVYYLDWREKKPI